jgi:glutamyl endopeptidase
MTESSDILHTPVSNVTAGAAETETAVSPGATGEAGNVLPAEGPVETLAATRTESSEVLTPPAVKLQDVGAASFRDTGLVLETVHGYDDRIRVQQTDAFPYRVNASLLITASDGSQWIGTGWFISPRTLITAGHCVYITDSSEPGRNGWVKSIQVMPGRNGSKLPFGSATSSHFWSVKGWTEHGNENYDYAAIILPTPLGTQLGYMGLASLSDAELVGAVANVTGYPGDKDPGTMWYGSKEIASVSPSKVTYDIDTAGGQSGAVVYVVRGGDRLAVAVHAYGGATTNSGTRISAPVYANLNNWKA